MTVIPVLSHNTVTSLAHRGIVPHRRLDFFYSNTNYFVQLEDTTIKTERFYLLIFFFFLNLSTFYNSSQVVKTRENKLKYTE